VAGGRPFSAEDASRPAHPKGGGRSRDRPAGRTTDPALEPLTADDAERLPVYGGRDWWDVSDGDLTSERRFILRLQERDERAFNELVEAYQARVFRLVFRMLGRRDEAEDMAQEVFVQVFKAVTQFRGESKLSTWIYRIAVNLCKNRTKYLARRYTNAQDELEPVAERTPLSEAKGVTYGDVSRPDHMVEGYQAEQIVRRCIGELEPDFREVLVLRDVEDLSYEEIAEITGLADGTVKSRIHRARAMLKTRVERALGEKIG
jgi:RNA polymerase sigma-70 factor (ECF subfamily)